MVEHVGNNIEFSLLDENRCVIPIEKWDAMNIIFYNILQQSFDNGISVKDEYKFYVEDANIYGFDDLERGILGLPREYPFDMYIQTNGMTLTNRNFKYTINFYTFYPGGELLSSQISGPFACINHVNYLLSKEQYELCEAISEFNNLDVNLRNSKMNYSCFSRIKELSKTAAVRLDSYFDSTSVYLPNKIKILIDFNDETLNLSPSIECDDNANHQFLSQYNENEKVSDLYSLKQQDGKRTKVILVDKQVEQLDLIKKRFSSVRNKEVIDDVISNPEQFFDSQTLDLSQFYSDRVISIGLYKPKYYTFICPYKSEWIPGIKIDNNIEGTKNLFFPNEEALLKFEEAVKSSINKGLHNFEWDNITINVSDALSCIESLKKQFALASQDRLLLCKQNKKEGEVLIIEENAEQLGYQTEIVNSEIESSYVFQDCRNLRDGISLKHHQLEGVAWLQYLVQNKYRGCLLADDMGLGKTLQILYFIQWHRNTFNVDRKPYLIVAPVSLLNNWESEYDKFFDEGRMYSTIIESHQIGKVFNQTAVDFIKSKELILTNYETIRSCQLNFCAVDYAVVVLDEAQKAKTPGSLITNSVKALKSGFKVAVTGTPVENTLIDLWCIMDFSVPGLLGTAKEFGKKYQSPIKNSDSDVELLGKELRIHLGNYFKRRIKAEIADELPQKNIFKFESLMPAKQKSRYLEEINAVITLRNSGNIQKGFMFKVISALRQISDSPYLVETDITKIETDEIINSSAKMVTTIKLLNEIKARQEKVIVFADHNNTQRMLQYVIMDKFGITPKIINGDTPATIKKNSQHQSRQQAIDTFQAKEGFNVIIMSPLAAGIGLNITEANNIIHYSRFWNPAKEQQATDRAYRIGQNKDVNVYYPMAIVKELKTFDQTIDELLDRKSHLASATLFPTMRAEIKQQELYDSLIINENQSVGKCYLDMDDVDRLDGYSFEAFTAAIYKSKGYQVYLTPRTSDKGIDVIAIGKDNSFAIQSKHSVNKIGTDGVYEAVGGNDYYQRKFNIDFRPLLFTNALFTKEASELGEGSNILLLDRNEISNLLSSTPVSYEDIEACELSRLDVI